MKPSATKRIAKNFSWLFSGEIISKGFMFFVFIYLARSLGAVAFGLLNFALAFLMYLNLIVDFGLSMYGKREIAKDRDKTSQIAINVFSIKFLLAFVVFVVAMLIVLLAVDSLELKLLFIGTFLLVFYHALEAGWVFQGMEKMEFSGLIRMTYTGLSLALILFFIKSAADLVKVPYLMFISGITVACVFLYIFFKYFASFKLKHFSPSQWKQLLFGAIPLGFSAVFVQIYYNMDTIMIGIMKTPEMVGLYNAAYRLFLGIMLLLGLWQATAFPVITRRLNTNKEKAIKFLRRYLKLALLVCIPIVFLTTLISPLIIRVFFGYNYLGASIALQILIWNMIAIAISGTYGTLVLIPIGKTKEVLWAVGSGALINIILNFILIPPYGLIGAAAATLITEIIVAVILFFFAYKLLPIGFLGSLSRPLIASLFSLLPGLVVLRYFEFGFAYKFISAGFIFIFIYLILLLMMGEKSFLMSFVGEILTANTEDHK